MDFLSMLNDNGTENNTGLRAGARFLQYNEETNEYELYTFEGGPTRAAVQEFLIGGGLLVAAFPGSQVTAVNGSNGQRYSLVPNGVIGAQRDADGKVIKAGKEWAIGGWLLVGNVQFGRFQGPKVLFGPIGDNISMDGGYSPASNSLSRPEEFGPHQEALSLAIFSILGENDGVSKVVSEADSHQQVVRNLTMALPQVFSGFTIDKAITEAAPKREMAFTNRGQVIKTGMDAINARGNRGGRRYGNQGQQTTGTVNAQTQAMLDQIRKQG